MERAAITPEQSVLRLVNDKNGTIGSLPLKLLNFPCTQRAIRFQFAATNPCRSACSAVRAIVARVPSHRHA